MAKKAQRIPLSAIPERKSKSSYPQHFKQAAVDRLKAGSSVPELAAELELSTSMLYNWQRQLDPLADVRQEINEAQRKRRMRLETAAAIVEAEGSYTATRIATSIRALAGLTLAPSTAERRARARRKSPKR